MVEHVCDAAGVPIPVCNKSCGSSLHHFNLVFLVLLIRIPDGTTVVLVLPHDGEVGPGLSFFASLSKVLSKKPQHVVCFLVTPLI